MTEKSIKKLKGKQARFVKEYLIDLNASGAARRAGYSERRCSEIGWQLLQKTTVQAAIDVERQKLSERTEISQDMVLKEYAKLAFYDPRKFFDVNGNLIQITNLDDISAAAVAGMDISKRTIGTEIEESIAKIKLTDKKAALDSVAKILGMFEKDNGQKGMAAIMGILSLLPESIKTKVKDEVLKKIG